MRPYPSYKDSGVEWIGEIPSGWESKRLQYISEIENSGVWGEDEPFEESIPLPIPTTAQLTIEGDWIYDEMSIRYLTKSELEKYRCLEGDIVVVKSSGSSTNIITGKCGYINPDDSKRFGFSNFLLRVRPNGLDSKLTYYFLQSNITKQRIERMVSSTTYPNLKVDEYVKSILFVPPLPAQQQIVTFLDHKTQLIDELIEKTGQKIALLKEKRTSLINHCVTKGLNPNVQMKDSGVDWIGEIPSHWEVKPLKYVSTHNQFTLSNNTDPDYELDYIEISDVNSDGIILNKTHYRFEDSPSRCRRILRKNDVFISTVRTYLKSIGFVQDEANDLICSTGFCVISTDKEMNPKLLFYTMRSNWFISNVISLSEGVSYPSIQSNKIVETKAVVPPQTEQMELVSYLDEESFEFKNLIEKETQRIELLKEYRQSLISEVVTGKIDVREEMVV